MLAVVDAAGLTALLLILSPACAETGEVPVQASYPTAIKCVLAHEGGYTNHPADPGGPTNWGITIHDARKYWKASATAADVKAMPLAVAQDIYEKRYWDVQRCDELPAGLDYSVFDYGVNSGIGRSGKVLRRLVGLPDNVSTVTPEVIAAVKKRDAAALIRAFNDERLRFLMSLRTWPTFGKGWGRRVAEVKALSLRMAAGDRTAIVSATQPGETMAKGGHKQPPIAGPIAAGAAGAGGAVVVPQTGALDWISAHPGLSVAIGMGAVVGAIAIAEFIVSRHEARQTNPMPGTAQVPVAAPS